LSAEKAISTIRSLLDEIAADEMDKISQVARAAASQLLTAASCTCLAWAIRRSRA
jgi:hypothetical protein